MPALVESGYSPHSTDAKCKPTGSTTMSDETTYFLENAKSARAACKKCKAKIAKGELRIGVSAPDHRTGHLSSSFHHPQCWSIGRKQKQDGVTAQSFVDNLLMDNTNEQLLKDADYKDSLITGLEEGGVSKKRHSTDNTDGIHNKKSKANTPHDHNEENVSSPIYDLYAAKKIDELKDVLRWNHQVGVTAKKDDLIMRCLDGHQFGRLGFCPSCELGKLKLSSETTVSCSGYFDEASRVKHSCFYSCNLMEAPRFFPWYYLAEPTEDEKLQMENTEKKSSAGGNKSNKVDDALLALLLHIDNTRWDLSSATGMKKVCNSMVQACTVFGRLNLPADEFAAKIEIGRLLIANKDNARDEICKAIIQHFGLKLTDKELEAKQHIMSALCACPANGPLYEVMIELGKIYFDEGNSMAGLTYKKVAAIIKDIGFEITEDNAKGLCKGKTKVAGIGKGSADKIFEFVTTGKISKLEEKRMR